MGPPRRAAEFVLVLNRRGRRKEAAGIEIGIAEVFENAAMELIGSRLENVILNALPFVHSFGAGCLNLELVHRLHRNPNARLRVSASVPALVNGRPSM